LNLKDKIATWPDGREYYILATRSIDDGEKNICLLSAMDKKADYSLWYFEHFDDQIKFSRYDRIDSEDLIKELLENFVETAFDE